MSIKIFFRYTLVFFLYLPFCGASQELLSTDMVLVGVNHPVFIKENKALTVNGLNIMSQSCYFSGVASFSNGRQLIGVLKKITKQYGSVRYLTIMGHSGYQGFFVEKNSGFHRDNYMFSYKGEPIYLSADAARTRDLKKEIDAKNIVFSDSSIIILMGCNTASLDENIAKELATVTRRPVIGPNQKINLFHSLESKGETMFGLENKSFLVYYSKDGMINRYEISTNVLTLTDAIEKVKLLLKKTH